MAKAVNEEWAPGCHTRVVAKNVDGSGDFDPVPLPKAPVLCRQDVHFGTGLS